MAYLPVIHPDRADSTYTLSAAKRIVPAFFLIDFSQCALAEASARNEKQRPGVRGSGRGRDRGAGWRLWFCHACPGIGRCILSSR